MDDGVIFQKVAVNDDMLRASGWRSIRQDGDLVQVVQWLGSGNAVVTEEAIAWVTGRQTSCVDALPEPCAPIDQEIVTRCARCRTRSRNRPRRSPTAMNRCIASFQFGWQVEIPDDGWTIIDAQIIGNSEYYQLQSGRSLVTIESAVDQSATPSSACSTTCALLQEVEDRAVIELGSDDPDERPAGLEQGHGWAIYTVEPLQEERADQEYTIRIDCYTLVEGQASLVVTHTAPRDLWTEERDKGERFRDGIVLPSIDVSTINPACRRQAGIREDHCNGHTANLDLACSVTASAESCRQSRAAVLGRSCRSRCRTRTHACFPIARRRPAALVNPFSHPVTIRMSRLPRRSHAGRTNP